MIKDLILLLVFLGVALAVALWLMSGAESARTLRRLFASIVESGRASRFLTLSVIACAVGALALAWVWRADSKDAWKSFAFSHGFELRDRSTLRPLGRVVGRVGGAEFELAVETRKDLHEREFRTYTRMHLAVPGMPLDLSITRRLGGPDWFGKLGRKLGERVTGRRVFETGDTAFDRRFVVHASDHDEAMAWLDGRRRGGLAELLSEPGYCVSAAGISWTTRHAPRSIERLDSVLDRLSRLAEILE